MFLNDEKRDEWIKDLAKGDKSLRELAGGVPHQIKGERLFEILVVNQVPLVRAGWFIKVVALDECSVLV